MCFHRAANRLLERGAVLIHEEIITLRKTRGKNIAEQFEDWDNQADTIFFDEETGMMMQSVTVAGGDVEQIPLF